jgi:hypothetical protein
MTALAKDRTKTQCRSTGRRIDVPMAAATKIYNGSIVCLDTAGNAVPGANTAGLRVVGRAAEQVDNTGAAGAKTISVDRGIFKWEPGTQPPVAATRGLPVFVQDDQTVGKGGAATSAGVFAGLMHEVDADASSIWVDMTPEVLMEGMNAGVEAIAAPGAISPLTRLTTLAIDGTDAFTLADGIYEGQRKTVTVLSGATTPVGTVTPATPAGHANVTAFGAIGDTCTWEWHFATGWWVVSAFGVTVA